jgi:hypothetical protein
MLLPAPGLVEGPPAPVTADSGDPDHPFRSIAITDSGDPDHVARLA